MIKRNTALDFIQEKIRNIGSALFYSEQSALPKYPTTIITARIIDDIGQIWFYMNKPTQNFQQLDDQFPARLDFFRKGKDYFLQILGRANVITDPEELSMFPDFDLEADPHIMEEKVLVKLKIQWAGYFDRAVHDKSGRKWSCWIEKILGYLFLKEPKLAPQFFMF
ncbi:MAG: hypothetical protein ACHQET_06540 [Chitinophagales bacterium]